MASGYVSTAYAVLGSAAASITTPTFTPTYGADGRVAVGVRYLPETNAVPSSGSDSEGGNTWASRDSITTDANGYQYQMWSTAGTLSGTGTMTVTINFTGGATNNAEAGSHITTVAVSGVGDAEAASGQSQTVVSGADNASTGVIGSPAATGAIAVGFFSHNVAPDNMTPSSGWTLIAFNNSAGGAYQMCQYQVLSGTSAVTATASVDQDGTMNNHGIIFPAAGGGSTTPSDADTGTLTDRVTGIALDGPSDTGTAVERVAGIELGTQRDTGGLGEGVPSIALALTDNATLSEVSSISQALIISGSDIATLDESIVDIQIDDGPDAILTEHVLGIALDGIRDTGTLAEHASITAVLVDRDTATLTDTGSVVQTGDTPSDSDSGTLNESAVVQVSITDADTFTATDRTAITADVSDPDSGAMGDAIAALLASLSDADSATLLEASTISMGVGPAGVLTGRVSIAPRLTGSVSFEPL